MIRPTGSPDDSAVTVPVIDPAMPGGMLPSLGRAPAGGTAGTTGGGISWLPAPAEPSELPESSDPPEPSVDPSAEPSAADSAASCTSTSATVTCPGTSKKLSFAVLVIGSPAKTWPRPNRNTAAQPAMIASRISAVSSPRVSQGRCLSVSAQIAVSGSSAASSEAESGGTAGAPGSAGTGVGSGWVAGAGGVGWAGE